MPNYCTNELRITGPKADLDQFRADAATFECAWDPKDTTTESFPCLLNFQAGAPYPKEGESDFELRSTDQAWYDWHIANWGTELNAVDVDINVTDLGITYKFNTAWAPPIPWLDHCTRRYPTLKFMLAFFAGGCDFCGIRVMKGEDTILTHDTEAWDSTELVDDSDWFDHQECNFWDGVEDTAKKVDMSFPSAPVPPGKSPF